MAPRRTTTCACPCEGVINLIGKKWSLCLITMLGNHGRLRFNALQQALPGISPRTLSDTLREMVQEGLVVRQVFPEAPPRVEYSLTEEGRAVREAVVPLMEWSARHRAQAGA